MFTQDDVLAIEPGFGLGYVQKRLTAPTEKPEAFFVIPKGESENKKILSINGDTATIEINGVLSRTGPDWIDKLFGFDGTAYNDIVEAVKDIESRDDIQTVRLEMNTPGGEVQGVDETYQLIAELAKSKKVYAVNNGLVASAGYWIASAANEIVGISPTVETGSIGVIITAIDRGKGGPYVKIVSRNAPNKSPDLQTEEGRSVLQERADSLERIFFQRISEGRGVSVEKIKSDFGQGGVLVAQDPDPDKQDAIRAGMIDRVIYSVAIDQNAARQNTNEPVANEDQPGDLETENTENEAMAENQDPVIDFGEQLTAVTKERDELKARIDAVTPFLSSDYPAKIKELAVRVLGGESKPETLEGAIVAFDAMREESNSQAAVEETNEVGETAGTPAPAVSEDGTINSALDFDTAVKEMRMKLGKEVQ